MELTKGKEVLGLPSNFKFGIEIEADNVQTKGEGGLYTGESARLIKSKNWHMATAMEESLVKHGGAELVSPVLTDNEADWTSVAEMCEHIKRFPGKKGEAVVANEECGLHIHFDSECITSNNDIYINFLRMYAESEELIYKMCNDVNDPIRRNAIYKNFHGIQIISSIWRNGMASPSGKRILKQIENGTLKVSHKKFGKLRMIFGKFKLDERRYHGLNLTNIGNEEKNTIEFRMSNGTLDPEVIKQNVFLYSSLMNAAIQSTLNPEQYAERLQRFYDTDVTEREKVENFLNLIMDNPEDRQIYIARWESVKDAPVFKDNAKKGFAQNRFKREEFETITQRTSPYKIKDAYEYIKSIFTRTVTKPKDKGDKGDMEHDDR